MPKYQLNQRVMAQRGDVFVPAKITEFAESDSLPAAYWVEFDGDPSGRVVRYETELRPMGSTLVAKVRALLWHPVFLIACSYTSAAICVVGEYRDRNTWYAWMWAACAIMWILLGGSRLRKFIHDRRAKRERERFERSLAGRFEPSSKTCSVCGSIKKDLTLKDREWECEVCHAKHDRDVNAAVNIKDFGLRNYIAFRKDVGLDKSEVTLRESVPLGTTLN